VIFPSPNVSHNKIRKETEFSYSSFYLGSLLLLRLLYPLPYKQYGSHSEKEDNQCPPVDGFQENYYGYDNTNQG
jgi:hypothetical protein